MRKGFFVLSGTNLKTFREWVPSATERLRLVRALMKLRRPGVRIEDERGNPVSFFQLKDMAAGSGATGLSSLFSLAPTCMI
jgi:hypothetical protein